MLDREGVAYTYREYRRDPLDIGELRALLVKLGLSAADVLRRRDPAFKELGLTGDEAAEDLIAHLAGNPTLLSRPIGVRGERAVIGRPVERLLDLV